MTKYKQHGDYHVSLVNFLDRISIVFQLKKKHLSEIWNGKKYSSRILNHRTRGSDIENHKINELIFPVQSPSCLAFLLSIQKFKPTFGLSDYYHNLHDLHYSNTIFYESFCHQNYLHILLSYQWQFNLKMRSIHYFFLGNSIIEQKKWSHPLSIFNWFLNAEFSYETAFIFSYKVTQLSFFDRQ